MSKQLLLPAFEHEIITIDVADIQFFKEIDAPLLNSTKFKVILSSIEEVGIIEPPVVTCKNGKYLLLDGHLRICALKKLKITKVTCLLSTDDEAFTYNKHVNRLSNIQEHKMIVKAIERGVSTERLAKVLNIDVASIMQKKNLLDGICPEVAEMLKDKIVPRDVFRYLKKMKPQRQIEAVTLMEDMNNYTNKFARSIYLASSDKQLLNPIKRANMLDVEKLGRLEDEVSRVQGEYKLMEDKYGIDVLNLTLIKGYIRSIFENQNVCNYLKMYEPDIFRQFKKIVELENINIQNDSFL
ncbi:MAG: plasmid partitioning protein RepB C-terminal domain-containing protein [Alphaproteobacteria bacterium]